MSQQYPPPPPNYGQPPMYPPGGGMGGPMAYPQRSSGASVASLVCGLILCIPIVTQLLAIILAFVGLRDTRNPGVSGRGMAVAGLILGIVGILLWLGGGGVVWWGIGEMRRLAATEVKSVVNAIAEGNLAQATTESRLTTEEVAALAEQIGDWGTVSDVTTELNWQDMQGGSSRGFPMRGTARFTKAGNKAFRVKVDSEGARDGGVRVSELKFE